MKFLFLLICASSQPIVVRCVVKMCNIWEHPTEKSKEITPEEIKLLPNVKFINITGGEPFIREDMDQIVDAVFKKYY